MTWCSAPHFEKIYLEVVVNDGLGVLVIQEDKKDEPKLVFCSLFEHPQDVFAEGRDRRDVGLTIADFRGIVTAIESAIASRPFS
jgi:hypothetical protein